MTSFQGLIPRYLLYLQVISTLFLIEPLIVLALILWTRLGKDDHCAVLLAVVVPDVDPPGPGLWKFNSSILEDVEYVDLISDLWVSWRASIHRFPSLAKWWE